MVPYESELSIPLWDEPRGLSASTLNIIKKYERGRGDQKDGVENGYSFVKQHCMHCLAPACVTACPVAALKKDPVSGIVFYEEERCIGCRYCQVACPFSVPKFEWRSNTPEIRKCQLCRHRYAAGDYAACCQYCPTGASLFGKVADLRKEANKRLGLAPGSEYAFPVGRLGSRQRSVRPVAAYVNHVYGMDEAGGTQYLMMSAVPFAALGFNPGITGQQYPELTWDYIYKVPYFIAALLLAGGASHYFTHRKDRNEEGE
jgi:Fe-S-cluster-containing dehydrogenase component